MATYEVDVGGKTYEVDAPDPNTAWQWANQTHQKSISAQPSQPKTQASPLVTLPSPLAWAPPEARRR